MKRLLALLTAALTVQMPTLLNAAEYPLESPQLAWRVLQFLPEQTIETIATSQLSADQKENADERQAAIQTLSDSVRATEEEALFMISKSVAYTEYDSAAKAFILNPVIPENSVAVKNRYFPSIQSGQLPGYFNLLVPNYTLANRIPMSNRKASALIEKRADLPRQLARRFYVEVFFRPVEFQQGRFVQTVIDRIDFYDHQKTRNLIKTVRESRKPARVISDSLIAEGITSQAVPIHNFTVLGIRMLEILSEGNDSLGACSHVDKVAEGTKHKMLECLRQYSHRNNKMKRRIGYTGGRLSELEFTLLESPGEEALKRLVFEMGREFGLPDLVEGNHEWTTHGIRFNYSPEYLYQTRGEQPFLRVSASVNHDDGKIIDEDANATP